MDEFDKFLESKLDERRANGLYRSLVQPVNLVDFSSNNYLGFARHPALQANSFSENELYSGATGSRLISGNSSLAESTEKIIANFHRAEAALIFNSGYDANVGLLSCIAGKNDTIITDQYVHASIIDGSRLSYAKRLKFGHNDIDDLANKLKVATGNKFVVVESVYSMDGDKAPLKQIAALCKKFNAALIVDEAHATGVFGEKGEGIVAQQQLDNEVFARIITFGKAIGLHGAAILGSHTLRNFLINHARSFIYSTALPPITYLQIQKAYELLPKADRGNLMKLIEYFAEKTKGLNIIKTICSHSPIQGLLIGDNKQSKDLSSFLEQRGYFIKAILSPTVPVGTERLRICLHSFNSKEEIDGLIGGCKQWEDEFFRPKY